MKIEVNFDNRQSAFLLLLACVVFAASLAVAYNESGYGGTPAITGHSVDEIDWSQTIAAYVMTSTGFCISENCIEAWPSVSQNCVMKRSSVQKKDAVVYCPDDKPLMFSCQIIDDQPPSSAPTSLADYCESDGLCNAGSKAPETYNRTDLGSDQAYLERVVNSDDVEGCWQYDSGHNRTPYRLEVMCCEPV